MSTSSVTCVYVCVCVCFGVGNSFILWNDIFGNKTSECQDFVRPKYDLKFSNNFSVEP